MSDPQLDDIRKKLKANERLSAADGEYLFSPEADLHEVGRLADAVRRRRHDQWLAASGIPPLADPSERRVYPAYFNRNAHINPTNVCIYRCALCAYSRDDDDPSAYTMTDAELLAAGQEAADAGCTELHIVSGAHPAKKFDWYLGITRPAARRVSPAALEGLDGHRDRSFCPHQRVARPPRPGGIDRGRLGQHAGRRGGNLRLAGPHGNLSPQGRRQSVARNPSHGARTRAAHERLDALRPHRERRNIASTTSAGSATCKTRPADSRPLCP